MNKNMIIGCLSVLLVIAAISIVLLVDLYKQDHEKVVVQEKEIKQLITRVEAFEANSEGELIKTGEHFIKTMFTFDQNSGDQLRESILKLTTGEAKGKLSANGKNANFEDLSSVSDQIKSNVKIISSQYNKIDADQAKVIVKFEQHLEYSGVLEKTVNEITLDLKYIKGEWKVSDYTLQQLL